MKRERRDLDLDRPLEGDIPVVETNDALAVDAHPVLLAEAVLLERDSLARVHDEPLDLNPVGVEKDRVRSPGSHDRRVREKERRGLDLEKVDRFLNPLTRAAPYHEERVLRVYHARAFHVDEHDHLVAPADDEIVPRVNENGRRFGKDGVCAFGIVGDGIEGIEAAEIVPADVARNDGNLVRALEDRIIDRDRRDRLHLLARRGKKRRVPARAGRFRDRRAGAKDLGAQALELREKRPRREAKDTGVPEVPSRLDIGASRRGIGLFLEGGNRLPLVLDVAVAGFGIGRLDAEGHQAARFRELDRPKARRAIGFRLDDEVVGRVDEDDLERVEGHRDERDRRGGVPPDRLDEPLPRGNPAP